MNCCEGNNKKRTINEISTPDSEHKNSKRVFNYLPWLSIIVVGIIIFYLLNI